MSVGIIVIIIKQRNSFCTKTRDNCDSAKEKKQQLLERRAHCQTHLVRSWKLEEFFSQLRKSF